MTRVHGVAILLGTASIAAIGVLSRCGGDVLADGGTDTNVVDVGLDIDMEASSPDASPDPYCHFIKPGTSQCGDCPRKSFCLINYPTINLMHQTGCYGPVPCDGAVNCACAASQTPSYCQLVKCEEVSPGCVAVTCDAGASG